MSFSRVTKLELLNYEIEDDSCCLSFLSGLFHSCGEISRNGGKLGISIVTDIQELYPYCQKIIKRLYGDDLEIELGDNFTINKNTYYEIIFPINSSEKILLDTGLIERCESGYNINFNIDRNIIFEEDCKKMFVRGVFIGSSTSSIRLSEVQSVKTASGYHLEFTSHSHDFIIDFSSVLAECNIMGNIVERKNLYVLYLKDVNTIIDLLALIGANEGVLALSNEIITRELRNKVNRQVNCINANINKTVEASMKQVNAINIINSTIGIESLPEDLQEVAVLRLANQEESLDELLKLSTIQLTRSGLAHRFRKLIKIANELGEDK